MKLYRASGIYVGTQADAKRLDKGFAPVEVPTDKDGLIAFLNALRGSQRASASAPPPIAGLDLIAPVACASGTAQNNAVKPLSAYESSADRVMTPADTDGIVQRIMGATGYELKRYASAVAQAFGKLGS